MIQANQCGISDDVWAGQISPAAISAFKPGPLPTPNPGPNDALANCAQINIKTNTCTNCNTGFNLTNG